MTLGARAQIGPMLALGFAATVTVVLYPGWLFWDSATQWLWATQIASGERPDGLSTQWPISNTLLKVPFAAFAPAGIGFYCLLQALLLGSAVTLFLSQRIAWTPLWVAVTLAVMLLPPIWTYAGFHSTDTLVGALVLLVFCLPAEAGPRRLVLATLLASLLLVLRDAMAPFVALFFIFELTRNWRYVPRPVAVLLAVGLVVLAGVLVMSRYQLGRYVNTSVDGLLVRAVLINQNAGDVQQLGPLFPSGTPHLGADCYEKLMWCPDYHDNVEPWRAANPDLTSAAYATFRDAVIRHPAEAAVTLTRIAAGYFGFPAIYDGEIGRNPPVRGFTYPAMTENAATLVPVLRAFHDLAGGVFSRPGVVFVLGLALVVVASWRNGGGRDDVGRAIMLLLGYAAPLSLVAPSYDFRYVFPFWLPMLLIGVASLVQLGTIALRAGGCVAASESEG
jgi:hypothetical protein